VAGAKRKKCHILDRLLLICRLQVSCLFAVMKARQYSSGMPWCVGAPMAGCFTSKKHMTVSSHIALCLLDGRPRDGSRIVCSFFLEAHADLCARTCCGLPKISVHIYRKILCSHRWCYSSAGGWLLLHKNSRHSAARAIFFFRSSSFPLLWFCRHSESVRSHYLNLANHEISHTMRMQVTWEIIIRFWVGFGK
jgi:hypothetical protein